MTKAEAKRMAAAIANTLDAVKGMAYVSKWSSHVGTWLDVPGIALVIHLDKRPAGRRYSIQHVIGTADCKVLLIEGDGRPGRGPFSARAIGTTAFNHNAIVRIIMDPMATIEEYCAYCRRTVDRDSEALEYFFDGTILHKHCAVDLRADGQLNEQGKEN